MGVTERERPTKSPVNQPVSSEGDAFADATNAPTPSPSPTPAPILPADLAELVNTWPALPPAIRAGILAMIQAAKGGA